MPTNPRMTAGALLLADPGTDSSETHPHRLVQRLGGGSLGQSTRINSSSTCSNRPCALS